VQWLVTDIMSMRVPLHADTGKPIALKEGTYSDQTVELKPSSTPEPQTGGMQPAYA
jgi:hypothetical protein